MKEFVPYCGQAPSPADLAWNLDPRLGSAIAALLFASLYWARKAPGWTPRREFCLAAGWLLLMVALLSPLCNLSVALFSARAAQHLIIAFGAAPLLAIGGIGGAVEGALHAIVKRGRFAARPPKRLASASILFAATFWLWHLPGPYDATLRDNAVYWSMQASVLVTSVWLWDGLLDEKAIQNMSFLIPGLVTGFQMSALGALLTLSSTAWFSVHEATTWSFGISPTEDQQLGGAFMWVVGCSFLTAVTMYSLARSLSMMDKLKVGPASSSGSGYPVLDR